jgi:flavodoxin
MRYKALSWLSIDLGIDYRLSSGDFSSPYGDRLEDKDMSVYPDWKVQLGLNFKILPVGVASKTASEREREVFNKRVDYFQNIIKERDESENIEIELENLKEERKQAEQELEELKQILQEEGN